MVGPECCRSVSRPHEVNAAWSNAFSMPMVARTAAAIATNRFGLGARPGEIDVAAGDPQAWLLGQLREPAPMPGRSGLEAASATLAQAEALRKEKRAGAGSVMKLGALYRSRYLEEVGARFAHAVATERAFVERLTQFWANHFAVSVDKLAVLGIAGAYEREAIRPHVLGRFEDLLFAVERHPAMLLYLDNHRSIGPGSPLARRAAARRGSDLGLNENLAREILELHTLGVSGGYTQADVTSFARMITGWSIGGGRGRLAAGRPGEFAFRENMHEPGAQTLLGQRYSESGYAQGAAALRTLARHPATAAHVTRKLACHFVADDPPPTLLARLDAAWRAHDGALVPVYRALVESPEAWAVPLAKFKTPSDFIHSTFRGFALPVGEGRAGIGAFEVLGQRTWAPGSPAGWPDRAADWDGASAVLARIEWADAVGTRLGDTRDARRAAGSMLGDVLASSTAEALRRAASGAQALTLLLSSPEFMRR